MEEISYPVKSANFDEDCYTDYKYALQPRVKQLQCDVKQLHILYNLPAFLSDVPWCPWEAFNITKRQCWQEKTAKGQIWPALNIFLVGRCILQKTYSTSMQLLSWGWGEVDKILLGQFRKTLGLWDATGYIIDRKVWRISLSAYQLRRQVFLEVKISHISQYWLLGPCLSQEANFRGFGGKNFAKKEEITTMPILLLVVKQPSRRGNYYYWWYWY